MTDSQSSRGYRARVTTEPTTPAPTTPVTSGRRREPADVRRTQILDGAERVFVERGIDAAMAEVAEVAGVAKGTVYLYFASKADLLAALRARYLERFAAAVGRALDGLHEPTTRAAVLQFAACLFDWSQENYALHHVLFHAAGVSEEDAFERGRTLMSELVRGGVESGELHTVDPDLTAQFLLDGLHGLLMATMHPPTPDRRRFDRAVAELVPRALGVASS
jgi:AcrR family transcriptional regulator